MLQKSHILVERLNTQIRPSLFTYSGRSGSSSLYKGKFQVALLGICDANCQKGLAMEIKISYIKISHISCNYQS